MRGLRDKVAIVGVGETDYTRGSGLSDFHLLLEAAKKAIDDAGLRPEDIDGVIPWWTTTGWEDFAVGLGIEDLKYHAFHQAGGANVGCQVQTAVLAIYCGAANYVLITAGGNFYSSTRGGNNSIPESELVRMRPGGKLRADFEHPYG